MSESGSASTILVVDDNDAERYYVARVLSKAGFEVLEAATGGDALRLAGGNPDLITLDVRLPDLSGFEVCRRLKTEHATRDIPVLHISASYTSPHFKAEGLEAGADGYLTHPVDPGELLATVRALLRVRKAEERVRAAAAEWTTTFDVISDAVCLTGSDERVARCNRAFAELVRRPFNGIIGTPLEELVPELAPLVKGLESLTADVTIGSRHYRVSRGPARDFRAWVLGDVTDRRRAEQQAEERLQEIEAVYNSSPAGLCVLDRDLRFVRINQRLAGMSGRTVAEHLGRTVREVLPEMADAFEPGLRQVLETGQPMLGIEFRGGTSAEPGVERVWVETWHPLWSPEGEVIGINIAAEEVTEQRRVAEQLQQAQRLEAVARLAGGVAHETNNQMTVVLGCANFVLRQPNLPEPVRDDLQQIRKAAERTATITAQLLAFGRRQIVRPEVVDLNQIIVRFHPVLARALGEKAQLALELGEHLPLVNADIGQMDQVLLNLTLNARDAMPGGGTLTIRTTAVDVAADGKWYQGGEVAPGRYAGVSVSDTGLGMDQETLRQVFEPFFTTKGVGKGTGLGLSMVYGIVRQSGGYITVTSAPGAGTTFEILLPEVMPEPQDSADAAAETVEASPRTILLVEDDEAVRRIIMRELAAGPYRVVEAQDGIHALELIRDWTGPLDAVITDLRMPGMDGLELAVHLAKLRPEVQVLFMSGHPDSATLESLAQTGRPFIQKPFTADELGRFIDSALKSR